MTIAWSLRVIKLRGEDQAERFLVALVFLSRCRLEDIVPNVWNSYLLHGECLVVENCAILTEEEGHTLDESVGKTRKALRTCNAFPALIFPPHYMIVACSLKII